MKSESFSLASGKKACGKHNTIYFSPVVCIRRKLSSYYSFYQNTTLYETGLIQYASKDPAITAIFPIPAVPEDEKAYTR